MKFKPSARRVSLPSRILAAALACAAFPAFAGKIEPGHSAMWIDPSRNGEGWIVEILPDDAAALYWYTSDDAGKPRWIISNGGGVIVRGETDDKIVFSELVTGHGGRFARDVPASDVTLEVVGWAEISFDDCNSGWISFDAYGKAATYPLTRLSRTMAAGCAPIHGTPGDVVQPYAGTSGTWFDPSSGGGPVFTLQWLADGAAILFWFAYDAQGNPFWAAGLGQVENDKLVVPQLDSVSGGRFGEDYPAEQATLVPWGSLELSFTCDSAVASVTPTAEGFEPGTFQLAPLTRLAKPACPWVKPKLTDLYDITLIELPEEPAIPPPTPNAYGSGNLIFPAAVANDGTVAAIRKMVDDTSVKYYPLRLRRNSMAWEDVPIPSGPFGIRSGLYISPQGDSIFFTTSSSSSKPYIFRNGTSNPLPGLVFNSSEIYGTSNDFSRILGIGFRQVGGSHRPFPWIWDAGRGQVELPTKGELAAPFANIASNDGRRVLGFNDGMIRAIPDLNGYMDFNGILGVYWGGEQEPQLIRGQNGEYLGTPLACDSNCDLVIGNTYWQTRWEYWLPQWGVYAGVLEGEVHHAWYWRPATGQSGSFGPLNPSEANPEGWDYSVFDVSGDGGLAVGIYHAPDMDGGLPNGGRAYDGLIWSQAAGFVRLSELLADIGQSLGWPSVYVGSISSNGEYMLLSTGEIFTAPQLGTPSFAKAAMLHLTPKLQSGHFHEKSSSSFSPAMNRVPHRRLPPFPGGH